MRALNLINMTDPKTKILEILETFGMSGLKASEAMGITYNTFRQKKNDNSIRHTFNERNYEKLVEYIKKHADELPRKTVNELLISYKIEKDGSSTSE